MGKVVIPEEIKQEYTGHAAKGARDKRQITDIKKSTDDSGYVIVYLHYFRKGEDLLKPGDYFTILPKIVKPGIKSKPYRKQHKDVYTVTEECLPGRIPGKESQHDFL